MTLARAIQSAHGLLRSGNVAAAEKQARDLIQAHPDSPAAWCLLGHCLIAMGRRVEAREAADRAALLPVDDGEQANSIGTLYSFCEHPQKALLWFERSVALAPERAGYLYNLATAQRMTGDLHGAESTINRYIEARPRDGEAYLLRSDLRPQTAQANHVEAMVGALTRNTHSPEDEVPLCFAIAKELEDLSQFESSFAYLKRACDLKRRTIRYAVEDDVATIDRIIELHSRAALDRRNGFQTDEPIFIIGLPRSGTTLVEQILSRHSAVATAGETQAFAMALTGAARRLAVGVTTKSDLVSLSLQIAPSELGQAYVSQARPPGTATRRFVDKTPTNYLYAGLIHRALPHARIVALARDPMDTCYAMYKALFPRDYPFSYGLCELGQYYGAWHRLMRHWKTVLGTNLLIVSYEALVTNQEQTTRSLLEHCGLEWEESCLAPHESKRAVTTASAAQVRRALYSSSIGKWCHYERQLLPLTGTLARLRPVTGWDLV